jgi:hypothetical protein
MTPRCGGRPRTSSAELHDPVGAEDSRPSPPPPLCLYLCRCPRRKSTLTAAAANAGSSGTSSCHITTFVTFLAPSSSSADPPSLSHTLIFRILLRRLRRAAASPLPALPPNSTASSSSPHPPFPLPPARALPGPCALYRPSLALKHFMDANIKVQ